MKTQGAINVDFIKSKFESNWVLRSCRFIIERDLLTTSTPLFVMQLQNDVDIGIEVFQFDWSSELAEYLLLQRPTKMDNLEEEAERLGYVLYTNIKSAEINWGRALANAVLIEVLNEKNQMHRYGIENLIVRAELSKSLFNHFDMNYVNCKKYLSHAIQGLQNTVMLMLKYEEPMTLSLMSNAIRKSLDTVYHLSARDALFKR